MTPEETNIACAEAAGWEPDQHFNGPVHWHKGTMLARSVEELPNFYGSIDAALKLVEFAANTGWSWDGNASCQKDFTVRFYRTIPDPTGVYSFTDESYCAASKSLSAAICAAFLKLPVESK